MAKKTIKGEDGKEYVMKEKKPFYKRWWFIALALFIVIGIIGQLGGSGDNESKKTASAPEEKVEEKDFKIGDTIDMENFTIVANSKSKSKEITDESGYLSTEPNEGSSFYIVNITIKNKSNDPKTLSNNSFILKNGEKSYISTTDILSDDSITFDTLNPDETKTGNIVFTVPDSVVDNPGFNLELSDSWLKGDVSGDLKINLEGDFQ